MLQVALNIIGILFTIFFVIGSHEFAHFWVARMLGVKVLRFSIGFGKILYRWFDKHGTEYVISLIPLGGYVKMLDEREGMVNPAEKHLAFNTQPYYKKTLIVAAGPFTNIFCALLIYWVIFMAGITTIKPVIGDIIPQSIAAASGLRAGSEIVEADNRRIYDWPDFIMRVILHVGDADTIAVTTQDKTNVRTNHKLDLHNWELNKLNPDPLKSLGIKPWMPDIPLVIGKMAKDSPAQKSGLQMHDQLLSVGKTQVKNWEEILQIIREHPDEILLFTVQRGQQKQIIPVKIGQQRHFFSPDTGYLGIAPQVKWPQEFKREIRLSPWPAFQQAWTELYDFTILNFILVGKIVTGKLSLQSLGGPITIFSTAGEALHSGVLAFLGFLAFLSISIGVINLLPIPGLDGGHLLFQTIESVIGKPIPERWMLLLYQLGFLLVFFILFYALMNDVLRLLA